MANTSGVFFIGIGLAICLSILAYDGIKKDEKDKGTQKTLLFKLYILSTAFLLGLIIWWVISEVAYSLDGEKAIGDKVFFDNATDISVKVLINSNNSFSLPAKHYTWIFARELQEGEAIIQVIDKESGASIEKCKLLIAPEKATAYIYNIGAKNTYLIRAVEYR